jgi:predicted metal-dependent hydrolase
MSAETDGSTSSIPVRQLLVDFGGGFPRWWHSGEPYLSHYWNGYSMLFPRGERHTVDIARDCLADLEKSDRPGLLADTRAFIGQEAAHRRVHIEYNRVLDAQGYRNQVEPVWEWQLGLMRRCSLRTQLATGAAFEHWTATLADFHLGTPTTTGGMVEPPRRVWDWHAVEETEHKSVLFDLYLRSGGRYWHRILMFLFMSLVLVFDLSYQQAAMLHHDRALHRPHTWWVALRAWFGRQGMAWHHLPRLAAYLSPGFHPNQHDSSALIADWKSRSAGQYRIVHAASGPSTALEAE